MDTSKEYIKMCEKAEIQKDWKPKDGDFVWHPNEGVEEFGCVEFPAEEGIVILSDVHTKEWWQNWLWLPRQDQLQEMIRGSDTNYYRLVKRFYKFISQKIPPNHFLYSMEQLWLAFVMKEKYNKIWNGEKWLPS